MFDQTLQKLTQKPLSYIGKLFVKFFSANQITFFGFFIGILMSISIFFELYLYALLFLVINRLCDGLDGVMARMTAPSPLGAYLDITFDFIIYASFVLAFGLHDQSNLIVSMFLLFSYICTGTTFLAQAILQPQIDNYSEDDRIEISKGFIYASGLIEGTETIIFMIITLIVPDAFIFFGLVFGVLCLITAIARILIFYKKYKNSAPK
tara:strand:- start:209 stop:832 length:624 start_codon:yes stop_codon:yes gene_type:complete